jgi:glycerophosphoryl diester phosphodiesterase
MQRLRHAVSVVAATTAVAATIAATAACHPARPAPRPAILPGKGVRVARSLGSVDRVPGTSSIEAFTASYRQGFRFFSTDVSGTADGALVCVTPGTEAWLGLPRPVGKLRLLELLQCRLAGAYHPASLLMLLEQLRRHPDAHVLLTLHPVSPWMLDRVADAIDRLDPALRGRVALTLATSEELATTLAAERARGSFAFLAVRRWATEPGSPSRLVGPDGAALAILPPDAATPEGVAEVHRAGGLVLADGVNTEAELTRLAASGIDGILTDALEPEPPP